MKRCFSKTATVLLTLSFMLIILGMFKIPRAWAAGEQWTSIDGNTADGLNTTGTTLEDFHGPSAISYNGDRYMAWTEYTDASPNSQKLRVKKYSSGSWSDASGVLNDDPSGTYYGNAREPALVVFDGELYIIWQEYTTFNSYDSSLIHVKKYSGGTTWISLDDTKSYDSAYHIITCDKSAKPCLNDIYADAKDPVLFVNNGVLYAAWVELNGKYNVRVVKYNGSDTSDDSYWTLVDGNSVCGINIDQDSNHNDSAYTPSLASYNNQLFAAWVETIIQANNHNCG
ncbi:MAG: hypothetical protein P4L69_19960 [Desulfosporosinus sp.]|nr:hypothetical protein [Desulfosporosinus sp.]